MLRYVLRRLLSAVPVLIGVTLITFLLVRAASHNYLPGLDYTVGLTAEEVERVRQLLGLDQPIHVQYWTWLSAAVRGDFGLSIADGRPVIALIAERLPNTLLLSATALLFAVLMAIPLGVTAALKRGSAVDNALTVVAVGGVSIPAFWMGLLLILLFSVSFHRWGWPSLPAGGATSSFGGGDVLDRLTHLVMPASVLAFGFLAVWSRFIRSSMLETLSQDYVRTARSKGLREKTVIYVHALRNALVPLVTLVGLQLPTLLGGSVVVESVFSWPGIGQLAISRAQQYDHTVVLGLTTIAAALVLLGGLLSDVLYARLDPRVNLA